MRTLALVSLLAFAAHARVDDEAPRAAQALAAGLASMLESPHAAQAARVERVAPVVDATHDFAAMSAAFTGARASAWSPEQRAAVEHAVRELVLASYAARLEAGGPGVAVVAGALEADTTPATFTLVVNPEVEGSQRVVCTPSSSAHDARIVDVRFGSESLLAELRGVLDAELTAGDPDALAAVLHARAERHARTPADVVLALQRELIGVMQAASELDFAGRFARLAPVVDDTHDLESVAKLVVSRQWKELGPDQRAALTLTFRELAIATYAARFDKHSGERFEGIDEESAGRSLVVRSRLVTGAGKEHVFEYLMRLDDGNWRIVNITVDGVSDLALKRQEYGDVLAADGFPALIAKLEAEIQRYRAGGKD